MNKTEEEKGRKTEVWWLRVCVREWFSRWTIGCKLWKERTEDLVEFVISKISSKVNELE